jgi:hypothetical protein
MVSPEAGGDTPLAINAAVAVVTAIVTTLIVSRVTRKSDVEKSQEIAFAIRRAERWEDALLGLRACLVEADRRWRGASIWVDILTCGETPKDRLQEMEASATAALDEAISQWRSEVDHTWDAEVSPRCDPGRPADRGVMLAMWTASSLVVPSEGWREFSERREELREAVKAAIKEIDAALQSPPIVRPTAGARMRRALRRLRKLLERPWHPKGS